MRTFYIMMLMLRLPPLYPFPLSSTSSTWTSRVLPRITRRKRTSSFSNSRPTWTPVSLPVQGTSVSFSDVATLMLFGKDGGVLWREQRAPSRPLMVLSPPRCTWAEEGERCGRRWSSLLSSTAAVERLLPTLLIPPGWCTWPLRDADVSTLRLACTSWLRGKRLARSFQISKLRSRPTGGPSSNSLFGSALMLSGLFKTFLLMLAAFPSLMTS